MEATIQERMRKAITNGSPYAYVQPERRRSELFDSLAAAHQRKGIAIESSKLDTLVTLLDKELEKYFAKSLTFDEVLLAIDLGEHGYFGEFHNITVNKLYQYVRDYNSLDDRKHIAADYYGTRRREGRKDRRSIIERLADEFDCNCLSTIEKWKDYNTMGAERFGKDFRTSAARIASQHVMQNCYLWLKSVGIVIDDADTNRAEQICFSNAQNELRNTKNCDAGRLSTFTGALLLESFYEAAKESDIDLESALNECLRWNPDRKTTVPMSTHVGFCRYDSTNPVDV